jgi:chromosome segregation ATPase
VAANVVEQASMKMGEWNQRLSVIEDNQKRMESNQNRMMEQFDGLTTEVAGLREEMSDVRNEQNMEREFLNGQYDEFRQQRQRSLQAPQVTAHHSVVLTTKPNANGNKTKKNPVPRKRGSK